MKTFGECLRNNWNSINASKDEERKLRISIQNSVDHLGKTEDEFIEWYVKNLWNEKSEPSKKKKVK